MNARGQCLLFEPQDRQPTVAEVKRWAAELKKEIAEGETVPAIVPDEKMFEEQSEP